jgi:hypothetical protein
MTGNPPVHGTIIVHAIADNGVVRNAEFTGDLPSPPTAVTSEPGSLLLLGSGTMGIACLVLWKRSMGRFVC